MRSAHSGLSSFLRTKSAGTSRAKISPSRESSIRGILWKTPAASMPPSVTRKWRWGGGRSAPDVENDRLPPWRENDLKKRANITEMIVSPLTRHEEFQLEWVNQVVKTSTGVDVCRRRWETQGYGHSGPKDEPVRHSHDGGAGEMFDLILPASEKEEGSLSPYG